MDKVNGHDFERELERKKLLDKAKSHLKSALDFQREADRHLKRAQRWLIVSLVFLSINLGIVLGKMIWRLSNG